MFELNDPNGAPPVGLGPGRVVSYPDPDGYVLVDGVLVRAVVPGGVPGDEVVVRADAGSGRLTAAVGQGDGAG